MFGATQAAAQSSKCAKIQGNSNLKTLLLLKVLPCKLYALSDEFFYVIKQTFTMRTCLPCINGLGHKV